MMILPRASRPVPSGSGCGRRCEERSSEAARAGFYNSPGWKTRHPRLEVLTVGELLEGKEIDMPPVGQVSVTFKKASEAEGDMPQQLTLEV
ncbi:MAG TPA: hypothetical protein VM537_18240 [Anaerolineae bacterium]|nr:hypothetical protein [Anaerolineae bacterium]